MTKKQKNQSWPGHHLLEGRWYCKFQPKIRFYINTVCIICVCVDLRRL